MKFFDDFCIYLSNVTTIDKGILAIVILTVTCLAFYSLVKTTGKFIIKKSFNDRKEFIISQLFRLTVNTFEVITLLIIWNEYIKNFVTLISVLSAAMTIALREIILNFFCGLYIKIKKPFKVEDRIQIEDIKGDVMNISSLEFEVLEVSTKEENGQSTGVVVTFPNSTVFTKPIKNINKGFKYIWNEIIVDIRLDCDLSSNKQEIYKIVNSLETIKNIPKKMKSLIDDINTDNRIYFNKYEPIIYTRIVHDHIELTVRYLMHPKKARYVESTIWNKIYNSFSEGKIDLYLGSDVSKFDFDNMKKISKKKDDNSKNENDIKNSAALINSIKND